MENIKEKKDETPLEFALRVMRESEVDIDVEYCVKQGIKYDNHEIDASEVILFDKKSTKAAFDLVTSLY